ncbi:TnsD family Tn7-like transposition protein [Nitrincola alkalilacustris]|uniref:TnsD family Tn7-like transposition protein n=1 Tax=Nitrincola alkalilacustris TaxID=1571224 RepID=UPI001456C9C6|nr:TnsD family Tn7-like transposition protein [Nitrincola alkalilacustris]
MIQQFPIAHEDELLGSVIARFIYRQGIKDDKVAIQQLFGSRLITSSALFQGHINQLLGRVGHLWNVSPRSVVEKHTLLPLFRPFVGRRRYEQLVGNLVGRAANCILLRSGVNASRVKWPDLYKICPICWQEQHREHGYSYWQRLFQCAGIECCPKHQCLLLETDLSLHSIHQHRFVGAQLLLQPRPLVVRSASSKQLVLAKRCQELLTSICLSPDFSLHDNWTHFYHRQAAEKGFTQGNSVRHADITEVILSYWGTDWLEKYGLGLNKDEHWLKGIFRKHRRPYSYLEHLVCWCALAPDHESTEAIIRRASKRGNVSRFTLADVPHKDGSKCSEYRRGWRELVSQCSSLKSIRAQREGARVYIWLYKHDRSWLKENLPPRLKVSRGMRVDWARRDRSLVREMIKLERSYQSDCAGPRRSKSWYGNQLNCSSLFDKKLALLPLCATFLIRYSETVEEYQARRLAHTMIKLIEEGRQWVPTYEIERMAGIRNETCRAAARKILRDEVKHWQHSEKISCRSLPQRS